MAYGAHSALTYEFNVTIYGTDIEISAFYSKLRITQCHNSRL